MAISLGYFQQTVTTAAALDLTQLTAAEKNILDYVLLIPEGSGLRWRGDGTNPTTAVGMPVATGATAKYDDPAKILSGALVVVAQSGTCTLNIEFFSGDPRG